MRSGGEGGPGMESGDGNPIPDASQVPDPKMPTPSLTRAQTPTTTTSPDRAVPTVEPRGVQRRG